MNITKRLRRAIEVTERYIQRNDYNVVYPIDFLFGIFNENSGVIEELLETINIDIKIFEQKIKDL